MFVFIEVSKILNFSHQFILFTLGSKSLSTTLFLKNMQIVAMSAFRLSILIPMLLL